MCSTRVRYFDGFCRAYPGVNHSWIFHVQEERELPELNCPFLTKNLLRQHCTRRIRRIDPSTVLHDQGRETRLSSERLLLCDGLRPHLPLAPGCDHSKNPAGLDFLQPAQCAFADDLAVAVLSFRDLMTALAHAFQTVRIIRNAVGCNMAVKDVNLCQNGYQITVRTLVKLQVVKCAKYVGTTIGPDGHIHRWHGTSEKFIQRVLKITSLPKAWSSDRAKNECIHQESGGEIVSLISQYFCFFTGVLRIHVRTWKRYSQS